MSGRVFVDGSDVQDGHRRLPQPRGQFVPADGLRQVVLPGQSAQDAFDLRQVPFGDDAQEVHQRQGLGVGKPIDHRLAIAAAGDEP